jgi:hypothetical protein
MQATKMRIKPMSTRKITDILVHIFCMTFYQVIIMSCYIFVKYVLTPQ